MPPFIINQAIHAVLGLVKIPEIDSGLVSRDEILLVVRHGNCVQSVFFARLVSCQVLAVFLLTDFLWLRNHETFALFKHLLRCYLSFNVLVFQCKELDIASRTSQHQWSVSWARYVY